MKTHSINLIPSFFLNPYNLKTSSLFPHQLQNLFLLYSETHKTVEKKTTVNFDFRQSKAREVQQL